MAGKPAGTIFVELDLDWSPYSRAQQKLKQDATSTTLDIEKNFKNLHIKSAQEFDMMRAKITNSYNAIANSSRATADDIVRAEKAKNDQITKLNDQQFGKQTSFIDGLKSNWLAATAVIYAAMRTVSKAWDMMDTAAKFEQQRVAFDRLAASYGSNGQQILSELKKMSGGTIDVMTLVEKAGTAMMMGIAPEKVSQLMEIARATARMTGQDVSKAFSDISLAVGRQSKMILDNLGIIVSIEKANQDYARSLGRTSDSLSDTEKKTAFLNATLSAGKDLMARMGDQVDTDRDKMERFKASVADLGLAFGKLGLVATPVIDAISWSINQMLDEENLRIARAIASNDAETLMMGLMGRPVRLPMPPRPSQPKSAPTTTPPKPLDPKELEQAGKEYGSFVDKILKLEADKSAEIGQIAMAEQELKEISWDYMAKVQKDATAQELDDLQKAMEEEGKLWEQSAKEEEKFTVDKLKANQSMYADLQGYAWESYNVQIKLIKAQKDEYIRSGVDVVTADRWMHEQIRRSWIDSARKGNDFFAGVKAGFLGLQNSVTTFGELGYQTMSNFTLSTGDLFKNLFGDALQRELKGFSDYWNAFCDSLKFRMIDTLSSIASEWAVKGVASWFAPGYGFLGDLMPSSGTGILSGLAGNIPILGSAISSVSSVVSKIPIVGSLLSKIFHEGGMIPYAHSGMFLKPDERMVVGQTGEGIVSRRGMNAIGGEAGLNSINRGSSGGSDRPLNISVIVAGEEFTALIARVSDGVRVKAERRNMGVKRIYN